MAVIKMNVLINQTEKYVPLERELFKNQIIFSLRNDCNIQNFILGLWTIQKSQIPSEKLSRLNPYCCLPFKFLYVSIRASV